MRALGSQGLVVSSVGLGCMPMSDFYGRVEDSTAIAAIRAALDAGVTFLDTADEYGPFLNEYIVGRAVRGRREKAIVATKFGYVRKASGEYLGINGRPEYVREACVASLSRLGTDVIDLYYQHRLDPSVPVEETVGAMAELVTEGKVRYIGLCEIGPETLARAHSVHPVSAVQSEYSLFSRNPETLLFRALQEMGVGFVAYSPLGRGMLSGSFDPAAPPAAGDMRSIRYPRLQGGNAVRNWELAQRIEGLARSAGVTRSQLSLCWILWKGRHVVPIPGSSSVRHIRENAAAMEIDVDPSVLEAVDRAIRPEEVAGARYFDMGLIEE